MKIVGIVLSILLFFSGCNRTQPELERGMALRSRVLQAEQISFTADIAADYGDTLQLFSLDCKSDAQGNLNFTVAAPETIAGISGIVTGGEGALTFDDTVLHFNLLTDDQLNPISAPWILIKTLRSGYLTSAGKEEDLVRLTIDDSYEDDALRLDIWLNEEDIPQRAEICHDGRTILTLSVKDFRIL